MPSFYSTGFIVNPCSSMMLRERKEVLLMLYYTIRIDTILSKYIYNKVQNLLLRKLLAQSGDQTDMFCNFYSPTDIIWLPKTVVRVLGYTND